MTLSIAVIGAGTAGSGAARRAAELGARVTLVERDAPASGSSGRSAAIYNVQTVDPLHIELRMRARELFFRLEAERGLPLNRIGNVRVAWTPADIERLEDVVKVQRDLGLGPQDSQLLTRRQLQELVPDLETGDLSGGLFGPRDGTIDGGYMCQALVDEAVELGATYLKADVIGHEALPAGGHRLQTSAGDVTADVVINAAGAWAGRVADVLGYSVPVLPQVHDIVKVRLPHPLSYTMPMVNLYMPGTEGEALYFRRFDDDTLLAGLHTYQVLDDHPIADPENYRPEVEPSYVEAVQKAIDERLHLDGLVVEAGWTGLYPLTSDGEFIIGPERHDESVITCTGLGGVGVTSGAMAGYTAAEWAIHSAPSTIPGARRWAPGRETLERLPA
ncbi:NAD(P)/FAD-dependent oxidoreductase [Kineococcus rhizosphaerae]|uniref:Sarcosine oxidase subunit beta n=1 Tax=Kineococcus rhizosphaerae TaxID=559628 RepID=A0A2T0QUV8_9ACTN|nr:FAD-binding oxidoreductase [Kineococcus rhizosphaerae]PRY08933.1 sarcosine oxidase subunit beta [Kineococcus rhizosphaerae]